MLMLYKPALKLTQDKNDDYKWYYGTWIIQIRFEPKLHMFRAMAWDKLGWKRWLKMGTNDGVYTTALSAAMHIDMREGREGSW